MNLQNGAEKVASLPTTAGVPLAMGWGKADSVLYIRTDKGLWQLPIPPGSQQATPLAGGDTLIAARSIGAWLGQPPFAEAIACPPGICLIGPKHDTTSLNETGHDPLRWGKDSVAWFEGNDVVIRPLGPGRTRRITLKDAPTNAREGSLGG